MAYYPVFLDLEGAPVLVAGGGRVAERKVEALLRRGAGVRVVAKTLTGRLRAWVDEGKVRLLGEAFAEEHLDGVRLVFAATDDRALNRRVSESARGRGIWVNAVDQPEDCDFIVPAVLTRGALQVAVSTSGKSPAFAARIRKELEARFGPEYGAFLELMGRVRQAVLSLGLDQEENRRIFADLVNSDLLDAFGRGDEERARSLLVEMLPAGVSADAFRIEMPQHGAGKKGTAKSSVADG